MRDCFRSPLALWVGRGSLSGQALQADVAVLHVLHDVFAPDALGPAEGPAEAGGRLSPAACTALLRPRRFGPGVPPALRPGGHEVTCSRALAPPCSRPPCMGGAPNSSLAPGRSLGQGRLTGWPSPASNPQDPGRPLCQFVGRDEKGNASTVVVVVMGGRGGCFTLFLVRVSLCCPSCCRIQRSTCLCLSSAGIKGVFTTLAF